MTKRKQPNPPSSAESRSSDDARTVLELLWLATQRDGTNASVLWGTVAETIRARFDPIDAELVAGLFERLARGDDPGDVFRTNKGGHPRKTQGGALDIAWRVHFAKNAEMRRIFFMSPLFFFGLFGFFFTNSLNKNAAAAIEQHIFKHIAKAEGLKVDTVRRYYDAYRAEIESIYPLENSD